MKESLVIGITGPTGAGKSVISNIFFNNNFKLIDADKIAKEVVDTNTVCQQKLKQTFGDDLYNNHILNRKLLANRAFSSSENTEKLNSITLPLILEDIKNLIGKYKEDNFNILIDAPLLFQTELDLLCDYSVTVICDLQTRKQRIMKRDNLDEYSAITRINAQPNDEYYTKKADYIIYNNSNKEEFLTQGKKLVENLLKLRG